ncbi:MAG: DUF2007 domain-containing protein [Anaerolineaceae bacterium]|nr:DUF2007 domain-containing protein [Anaerolineaceae bacterium]
MTDKYVTVYTAQGRLEAETVRILLESAEIPAIIFQESVGLTFGLTVGRMGAAEVKVPCGEVTKAIELIRAMEAGQLALPEDDYDEEEDDLGDETSTDGD